MFRFDEPDLSLAKRMCEDENLVFRPLSCAARGLLQDGASKRWRGVTDFLPASPGRNADTSPLAASRAAGDRASWEKRLWRSLRGPAQRPNRAGWHALRYSEGRARHALRSTSERATPVLGFEPVDERKGCRAPPSCAVKCGPGIFACVAKAGRDATSSHIFHPIDAKSEINTATLPAPERGNGLAPTPGGERCAPGVIFADWTTQIPPSPQRTSREGQVYNGQAIVKSIALLSPSKQAQVEALFLKWLRQHGGSPGAAGFPHKYWVAGITVLFP
jgi:hypothetical protein